MSNRNKYIIKVVLIIVVFCLIEFLRLGYMKKDQAQQTEDLERFERVEIQLDELNARITELENNN